MKIFYKTNPNTSKTLYQISSIMKKVILILVLGLLLCSNGFSVEPLKENQKGKIKFQSIPTITLNQFLRGENQEKKRRF